MKKKKDVKKDAETKPFISESPDNREGIGTDTEPTSDPNYSYYPHVAYPTGPEQKEDELPGT